ncbi:MAG: transposase [Rubripirellula sp.]|nr:transposase [Rubripirellula sp.]
MPQKRHTVDQIVAKSRQADVELGKGKQVPEVCKLLEVTEQTYYRWRQKYGDMKPEMVKQLKTLEKRTHGCRRWSLSRLSIWRFSRRLPRAALGRTAMSNRSMAHFAMSC